MKRRIFLKALAACAVPVAFPQIVRAQTLGLNGKVSPSNRITLGLIGAGPQGVGIMRNALGDDRAQVIAVCDVDEQRRLAARQIVTERYAGKPGLDNACSDHGDFQEIISRPDIDAVLIATPDHWHALATVAAARAGKHLYCEKPAAPTIAEGRAMADAVARAGVVAQGGNMQRSHSGFQRAIDLVRGGYLGRITRVQVGLPSGGGVELNDLGPESPPPGFDYERWLGPAPALPYHQKRCHYEWRWNFDFGSGQLGDWICHHFDIAAVAMGVNRLQPVAVRNVAGVLRPGNPIYNTATSYRAEVAYANGVVIHVGSSFPDGARFEGTEGWIHVNRGGTQYSSELLRNVVIPTQGQTIGRGDRVHMLNFISCIKTSARPRSPIDEMHNVTAVAHLINTAIRSGRSELRWDPAAERLIDAPDAERFLARAYRAPWAMPA